MALIFGTTEGGKLKHWKRALSSVSREHKYPPLTQALERERRTLAHLQPHSPRGTAMASASCRYLSIQSILFCGGLICAYPRSRALISIHNTSLEEQMAFCKHGELLCAICVWRGGYHVTGHVPLVLLLKVCLL